MVLLTTSYYFLASAGRVSFSTLLQTLKQFADSDRNALRKVLWSMELRPVAIGNGGRERVVDYPANHRFTVEISQ